MDMRSGFKICNPLSQLAIAPAYYHNYVLLESNTSEYGCAQPGLIQLNSHDFGSKT